MRNTKKAFTLVELIVVVTILAILSTIGFVSYSGYLSGIRDTNRISQLKAIGDSLYMYQTKKPLPYPSKKIEIKGSGELLAYQGYLGKNTVETIGYTAEGTDPKDNTYFTYYITDSRKYFTLGAFLENQQDEVFTSVLSKTNARDYESRYPFVEGDRLGMLLAEDNTPIQEVQEIMDAGVLDIMTTTGTFRGIIENGFEFTGTGGTLNRLKFTNLAGGVRNSCKDALKYNRKLKGQDGYYLINQSQPTEVWCDMTTDGGGWTRYVYSKGPYTWQEAKNCWLSDRNLTGSGTFDYPLTSGNIECFNPNRLNFEVSDFMAKTSGRTAGAGNDTGTNVNGVRMKRFNQKYPSEIVENKKGSYYCKGGTGYMTAMRTSTYPKSDLSDVTRLRMGLSYCGSDQNSPNAREVGGRTSGSYMNYSSGGKNGPNPGTRRSEHFGVAELFVR